MWQLYSIVIHLAIWILFKTASAGLEMNMRTVKVLIVCLSVLGIFGCEPVDTPDSVMYSTHNTEYSSAPSNT